MKDKKSFLAYVEWGETFDYLDNEQAGRLVKHIFDYVRDKNPTNSDPIINLAFIPIKQTLKRDLNKWVDKSETNRLNGAKGGRPKKPKETEISERLISKPKKGVSVSVSVNDNDTVTVSDIVNEEPTVDLFKIIFEEFITDAFKYIGKDYSRGNPNTHRIESIIRKWIITQDVTEQTKNLAAYIKVTEKKFRSKTMSGLLDKLSEYNYTQDLKQSLMSNSGPKKTPDQIKADKKAQADMMSGYDRLKKEAQDRLKIPNDGT